jgi:anion-transporting  ArsA/GET3 family ATPase
MLKNDFLNKKCIIVCGGGGVGKTTTAAAIAVAATRTRPRVLVVTIDPAKRLAEAFGFSVEELLAGGEPKRIQGQQAQALGLAEGAELSVGILNPKYVLQQIIDQVLSPAQRERLVNTMLYQQLSEMVYGLQEYTAYEWVTRMIQSGQYDLIVLDTPPAFHAKDFFNVPQKIQNLMESRVFQIFAPKKPGIFSAILGGAMSFPWVEKLLGARVFSESRLFFETFNALRGRILERCQWLSRFFQDEMVSVVAVTTTESSAQLELEGLQQFMATKGIVLSSVLVNQVEQGPVQLPAWEAEIQNHSELLLKKWKELQEYQLARSEKALQSIEAARRKFGTSVEVLPVPMVYSNDGLEILRQTSVSIQY